MTPNAAAKRVWQRLSAAFLAVSSALAACQTPIASALSEEDANKTLVALEAHDLAAHKTPDERHEGRWKVEVAEHEAQHAVEVLAQEALPPRNSPGVLEALGGTSLVPSAAAEQARLLVGTAGDLERSLQSVDGILSARVHLAVPDAEIFEPEARLPASASVLLRHRGAEAPLSVDDVKRLVAGAVSGLSVERVSVVLTPQNVIREEPRAFAHFGPLSVAATSLGPLRAMMAAAIALNLALVSAVVALWLKLRRTAPRLDSSTSFHDSTTGAES